MRNTKFKVLLGQVQSRAFSGNNKNKFLFFAISSVVFFLDFLNVKFFEDIKTYIDIPLTEMKIFASRVIEFPNAISNLILLKKENERLRLELDKAKIKNIIATSNEQELNELKKILNANYNSNFFEGIEKVLAYEKGMYDSYIIITANSQYTKNDSIVSSPEGLVGIIKNCNGTFAKIIPVTSSQFFVAVQNDNGNKLILNGCNSNMLVSTVFESNTLNEFSVGDILFTTGEDGILRKNIPVAKISKIDKDQVAIYTVPCVDIKTLKYVWIEKPIS
ncbi:MAG: rod shape-determining protein MreC [Alphaproteobacteria bacterium]|nr:rod shape-determining protein MreC [Alphaproteobacteria bacterium]